MESFATFIPKKSFKGKFQMVDQITLTSNIIKLQLVEDILNVFAKQRIVCSSSQETATNYANFLFIFVFRNPSNISKQEIDDISMEIKKFNRIMQFLVMNDEKNYTDPKIESARDDCRKLMVDIRPYSENKDRDFKLKLEKFKELTKSTLNISDKEKTEIMRALNLRKGHYFKCPNGHVYIITECGGASQLGTCNECGAQIGGTGHALLSTNAVATEMDGATYPAYSDTANIANFGFNFR